MNTEERYVYDEDNCTWNLIKGERPNLDEVCEYTGDDDDSNDQWAGILIHGTKERTHDNYESKCLQPEVWTNVLVCNRYLSAQVQGRS